MRLFSLLFSILALLAPPSRADTVLHYSSESGDYIGEGQERTIKASAGFTDSLTATFDNGKPAAVDFYIHNSDYSQFYTLDPGTPGLDFSANGAGSNTLTGQFQVLEIAYTGATITKFAANFV